jgi:hypothetical protein
VSIPTSLVLILNLNASLGLYIMYRSCCSYYCILSTKCSWVLRVPRSVHWTRCSKCRGLSLLRRQDSIIWRTSAHFPVLIHRISSFPVATSKFAHSYRHGITLRGAGLAPTHSLARIYCDKIYESIGGSTPPKNFRRSGKHFVFISALHTIAATLPAKPAASR